METDSGLSHTLKRHVVVLPHGVSECGRTVLWGSTGSRTVGSMETVLRVRGVLDG